MSTISNRNSTFVDIAHESGDGQATIVSGIAARIRDRASTLGLSSAALAEKLEIGKSSMANYWAGKRAFPIEKLEQLADTLKTDVDWLIRAAQPKPTIVMDASSADWVSLPEFDLRAITASGKGDPLGSTVYRRDWLNRTLLTDSSLWTTRLISGYPPSGLDEGEQVIVQDMSLSDLAEGHLCIWGMDLMGELTSRLVGRYSMRAFNKGLLDDGDGGILIDPGLVGADEHGQGGPDRYFLIGRILGRPLAAIR